MVQQPQPTERHWREQTGAGERTAPSLLERSTSQGDKERNSLGPARFPRTFVRYVANDDGTPVTEGTDILLRAILDELRALVAEVKALRVAP